MTHLLMGGAGLIGTSLTKRLLQQGESVVIIDNMRSSKSLDEWRRPSYAYRMQQVTEAQVVRADVRDAETVNLIAKQYRPDVVYYLCALLAYESTQNPVEAREVQITGLLNTIDALESNGQAFKLILASSSYVYGSFVAFPAAEDHPICPIDTYGGLKAEAEALVRSFDWRVGQWSILRPASVYGVGDPRRRYATLAIEQAASGQLVELTYPDFVCDFTYVEDVAKAFALAAGTSFIPYSIYNVTFGLAHTNRDFVNALRRACPDIQVIEPGVPPIIAPIRGAVDSRKAGHILNWHPKFDIDSGIRDALYHARNIYRG